MKKKSGFKFEDIVRQNIIKILAEKGIQQKEIAEKMNKHPQQINNALRKRTTIINLIPEFANCLGVDEMVLFQPLNNISICQKIYRVKPLPVNLLPVSDPRYNNLRVFPVNGIIDPIIIKS